VFRMDPAPKNRRSTLRLFRRTGFSPSPRRWMAARILGMLVLFLASCTPKVVRFDVKIPGNAPAAGAAAAQGTTHVCPDTSVTLSWEVRGRASLSVAPGPRFEPPLCLAGSSVPSSGERTLVPCASDAILRVTASHSFWRWGGTCPGHGCDNADHEVLTASEVTESVGGQTDKCPVGQCELTIMKPPVDWDQRFTVGVVSIAGTSTATLLQQTPSRTLNVSHDGKTAKFTATNLASDALQGERFSGIWILRLSDCVSGCAPLPPVLEVHTTAKCSR
jgi:hypothetical protein